MPTLGVYVDGNRVSTTDNLGSSVPGTTITIGALLTAKAVTVKCDAGWRSPQPVTVVPLNADKETDLRVDVSDSDESNQSSVTLGYVGDTAVSLSERQLTSAALDDRNASLRFTFGGDLIALPAITVGPSISSVTSVGCTVTSTFNASVSSAKYIVKTSNTAPSEGDWTGAAAFTSPKVITGLNSTTLYYVFVRVYDSVGFYATSAAQAFTTTAISNFAPTFSAQPSVKSGTLTTYNAVIEYGATDSDGDTVSHEVSSNLGAYASITPTLNGTSGKWEYTIPDGAANTARTFRFRLTDADHTGTNGTLSASQLIVTTNVLAQVGTVTPTAGDTQVALAWTAITGAVSYNVRHSAASNMSSPTTVTTATNSKTVTGLTNAALRYFDVQAVDAAGNVGAVSVVVSATPALPHTDDFTGTVGAAPDTALWAVATANSGAVTLSGSGECVITTFTTASNAALLYRKTAVTNASTKTYKHKFTIPTQGSAALRVLSLLDATTNTGANVGPNISLLYNSGPAETSGVPALTIVYVDNVSAAKYWNGSAYAGTGAYPITITNGTAYVAILETTATQWQLTVKNADESSTLMQGAWVNWSGTKAWVNSSWLIVGDSSTAANYGTINLDWYDEV